MPAFQYDSVDPCPTCSDDTHAVLHMHCPACGKPLNAVWHKDEPDDGVEVHCISCGYSFPVVNPHRAKHMERRQQLEQAFQQSPDIKPCPITPRQAEVVRAWIKHDKLEDIAGALSVSPETVKSHIKDILQRTNRNSMGRAVLSLMVDGFIHDADESDNMTS